MVVRINLAVGARRMLDLAGPLVAYCQRADRIQDEGSSQRSTSIKGSTKVGLK